ncbi:hypothetical protein BH23GEM9_BH23GEM9_22090 [soil metagenome]
MSLVRFSRRATSAAASVLIVGGLTGAASLRWGLHGHEIAGRAAATNLPPAMPAFFRNATEQLAYLNPEPDRWRGDRFRELNEAKRYDHYVDFEIIPDSIIVAADRFQYLMALQRHGVGNPARDAGLLHFRIVEQYQSLVVQWRLWRREQDPVRRGWIEQRIINDAGIIGHYVTDGSNPHHTSVHHDGWRTDYPNPRGFTTGRGFHSRFEIQFVEANIRAADLLPHIDASPRRLDDVRAEVMAHLLRSHDRLERLYELDQIEAFGRNTKGVAHREFAIERLVAGANMLRDIWWTAWLDSEPPVQDGR